MRITLGLALLLTPALLTNAAGFLPKSPNEIEGAITPESGDHPEPDPNDPNDPGIGPGGTPINNPSNNPDPGEAGEDEPERDLAEKIYDIIDTISSLISLLEDSTSTSATGVAFPTAAQPCTSARDFFNSCSTKASRLNAADDADASRCGADVACYENGPNPSTTPFSIYQSSCLCTQSQSPGLFEGYLGSCNTYVQAQTQLAAQPSLALATAFCTTEGNAMVSPTPATASITHSGSAANSSKSSQSSSSNSTKSAATALSPTKMSSGSWYMVAWWTVIVLVGSGSIGGL